MRTIRRSLRQGQGDTRRPSGSNTSGNRGLKRVDGLLVGVVAGPGLLAVTLVFLLGGGGAVGVPGELGPQVLGFTLTVLGVVVWPTLSRR